MALRAIRGRYRKLATAEELLMFNSTLIQDVLSGQVEVDVGRCVGYLATLQQRLVESGELERCLAQLEQQLAQGGTKRWA
jgi:hypothetical protein